MSIRIFGPTPLLVSVKMERDPVRGFSTIYTYEGDYRSIYGLARQVRANQRYSIDDTDKPLFRLTLQSPDAGVQETASDYVRQFELLGNDVELSIYDHPTSRSLGDAVLTAVKIGVKTVEDANTADAAAAVTTQTSAIRAVAGATNADSAESLFKLLLKGTTSFVSSQYVLRRTQTVNSPVQVLINYAGIDRIHDSASVIQLELMQPNQLTIPIYFAITSIEVPTAQTGYAWGWLKKSPTVNAASNGKYTIAQEYWLAQWSTYLYGALLTPADL